MNGGRPGVAEVARVAAAAGDCSGGVREVAASQADVAACAVADSGSWFDWDREGEVVEFVRLNCSYYDSNYYHHRRRMNRKRCWLLLRWDRMRVTGRLWRRNHH